MSARNGDKSRFHRLRKAKIRRRLRTELLHSLVTTAPAATEAPAKPPKPPKVKAAEAVAPKAEAAAKPKAEKAKAPKPAATQSGEGPVRGPLAAVAETLGSTIGTIVAKTAHPHPDAEPSDKPAE